MDDKDVRREEDMEEAAASADQVERLVMRFPILLNSHAVAVIHVFTRHDCIEDIWMSDCYH